LCVAYEIPQQLQHKEKILFGLTFSQLAWALLFGFIILIIFKTDASITMKFILASIPAMIGILFIFFDISKWIKYFFVFIRARRISLESRHMKDIIEIKKVEKDTIFSHNEVAILQITPLNYAIMTSDEKNSIIYGFQRFLNGLDFSVQFIVSTYNLNMDAYLDNLEKRATNKSLFEDFSEFLKSLINQNQIRNRNFYLVIPKKSDLEIQCRVCKERLESIGLKVTRLKDKQILDRLYYFFNDVTDKRDEEHASDEPLQYLIAPNLIKDNADSLQVNNKYCRIISAVGYPRSVESGFLDKIVSSNDDFDISIHIEPFPIDTMMVMLNKELQKQRADLYSEEKKLSINPSLEIKYKDTLKVLESLQKGDKKLFNVSLYINAKGQTAEELDLLTKKIEAELNSIMIVPNVPFFRQKMGYKSIIPIAKD